MTSIESTTVEADDKTNPIAGLDRVLYATDEDGDRVVHVKLPTGEYATVDSDAYDLLRALGAHQGWYRTVNPATGKASVVIPSRSPRVPMVFLSRVITGAGRRHRVLHSAGPFVLTRKALALLEAPKVLGIREASGNYPAESQHD